MLFMAKNDGKADDTGARGACVELTTRRKRSRGRSRIGACVMRDSGVGGETYFTY